MALPLHILSQGTFKAYILLSLGREHFILDPVGTAYHCNELPKGWTDSVPLLNPFYPPKLIALS